MNNIAATGRYELSYNGFTLRVAELEDAASILRILGRKVRHDIVWCDDSVTPALRVTDTLLRQNVTLMWVLRHYRPGW